MSLSEAKVALCGDTRAVAGEYEVSGLLCPAEAAN